MVFRTEVLLPCCSEAAKLLVSFSTKTDAWQSLPNMIKKGTFKYKCFLLEPLHTLNLHLSTMNTRCLKQKILILSCENNKHYLKKKRVCKLQIGNQIRFPYNSFEPTEYKMFEIWTGFPLLYNSE